jgi:hypothetical protein
VDHDFEGVADLQFLRFDRERELAERKDAFGLAADVDEQFVLIFRNDDAGEDLAFIENLEALFVEALLESELVLFLFRRCCYGSSGLRGRGRLGGGFGCRRLGLLVGSVGRGVDGGSDGG